MLLQSCYKIQEKEVIKANNYECSASPKISFNEILGLRRYFYALEKLLLQQIKGGTENGNTPYL